MSLLNHAGIAARIPHQGSMCLLGHVNAWDASTIDCTAISLHERNNPLRRADGTLGCASLIEVAAQAMALHGSLTSNPASPPARGFLASVRDVRLATITLAENPAPISIIAELLMGGPAGASYHFTLRQNNAALISGRATVVLEARSVSVLDAS